ncbi:MAG: type II toxin-antitoxin system VapC family toxin [Verrucomicrobiae bacterium]|nr:type II toxin-antitoxin system VapC family toxin [Verrucomicrobiae bacterium]
MTGLDTTILVALVIREHELHERATRTLQRELGGGERFALTPEVVSEFIHIVTDARRFRQPLTMPQALADARFWWTSAQTHQVFATSAVVELCLSWMERHQLGRKRILDTLLAASLHAGGVKRLFTANPVDFEVFDRFELVVP